MSQAPFVVQPQLTAIALTYRNQRLIADDVLPRVPVDSDVFKYSLFNMADGFTVPDSRVGRKSAVNQIDWTATEQTAATQDFALEDPIPMADIRRAQAARAVAGVMPIDPEARSTLLLTDLIALGREVRTANLVFNANSYATANKTTLTGTSQWSDPSSDPVNAILTAADSMIVRPNVMVMGRAVWTKLRQHPKVVAAVFAMGGNAASGGVVSLQAVADLLELDRILVGEGFVNTARKGQSPNMVRVWGKHASLMYQAPVLQSAEGTMTFGFTGQWLGRVAGTRQDPNVGIEGGVIVRVGERLKELVVANDVGYFFQNAVA
jgi:hypothetical protein